MLAKLFFDESQQKESLRIAAVLFYYYNFDSSLAHKFISPTIIMGTQFPDKFDKVLQTFLSDWSIEFETPIEYHRKYAIWPIIAPYISILENCLMKKPLT